MSKNKIDKEIIIELSKLLTETGLSEIEWSFEGLRVKVSKNSTSPPLIVSNPGSNTDKQNIQNSESVDKEDYMNHIGSIKSPMVGTAYLSPEPGAEPFVKVGEEVVEGQTLLIVEAMKTMNPIIATSSGKVSKILIENESPVEFGQVLLIIE
ncbi:acetyl-CoA carboxylase biotin carboxyl carrier protein [Alphaproteobacteria bacterium]|nr:acetyl-CoA carboxylase biotin carboxyl carrier protein [Alphaproteobacteria bacterium]